MIYIYILLRHNVPFYVGKTNNLSNRLSEHKKKFNRDIEIEAIHLVENNDWKFWENHYIDLFKSWGFNLTNKNRGGGGLINHTSETKNKISQILKNKPKPEVFKKFMSGFRQGTTHTLESKQQISNNKKGSKYEIKIKGKDHKRYGKKDTPEILDKKNPDTFFYKV